MKLTPDGYHFTFADRGYEFQVNAFARWDDDDKEAAGWNARVCFDAIGRTSAEAAVKALAVAVREFLRQLEELE